MTLPLYRYADFDEITTKFGTIAAYYNNVISWSHYTKVRFCWLCNTKGGVAGNFGGSSEWSVCRLAETTFLPSEWRVA